METVVLSDGNLEVQGSGAIEVAFPSDVDSHLVEGCAQEEDSEKPQPTAPEVTETKCKVTPLDLAKRKGHHYVVKLLLSISARHTTEEAIPKTVSQEEESEGDGGIPALESSNNESFARSSNDILNKRKRVTEDMASLTNTAAQLASAGHATAGNETEEPKTVSFAALLLNMKCKKDPRPPGGLLYEAADQGNIFLVEHLLRFGSNPNDEAERHNVNNITPLHAAIIQEHVDIVPILLKAGASLNTKTKDVGWTPFLAALNLPSEEIAMQILKFITGATEAQGAKDLKSALSNVDNSGFGPFHTAARMGHAQVITLLNELGIDSYTTEPEMGWYPLHIAADHGYVEVVRALAETHYRREQEDKRRDKRREEENKRREEEEERANVRRFELAAALRTWCCPRCGWEVFQRRVASSGPSARDRYALYCSQCPWEVENTCEDYASEEPIVTSEDSEEHLSEPIVTSEDSEEHLSDQEFIDDSEDETFLKKRKTVHQKFLEQRNQDRRRIRSSSEES